MSRFYCYRPGISIARQTSLCVLFYLLFESRVFCDRIHIQFSRLKFSNEKFVHCQEITSYRKNLHVSNAFVPMPFFRMPLPSGTRQTSPHQHSYHGMLVAMQHSLCSIRNGSFLMDFYRLCFRFYKRLTFGARYSRLKHSVCFLLAQIPFRFSELS